MPTTQTHTPGPWEAIIGNKETNGGWEGFTFDEVHSSDGDLVALVVPERAGLIAAAPELLEALKGIMEQKGYKELWPGSRMTIEQAIAKAEGR